MHIHASPSLVVAATMWFGMMTAMMAPSVWPWVLASRRFGINTLMFASGYLAAWAVYSIAAAALQLKLAPLPAIGGAAVLILAGLFQFTAFKQACLTHCRNPLTYFVTRWRNGPAGGFRLGFGHGIFCVGCCWALMLTALAAGIAGTLWMALLTAAVFAEQVLRSGDRLSRLIGGILIAVGVSVAFW
jgi:predicted metal-binding membrane protein